MTLGQLARSSLRYYRRTHLGVVLGAALGALVLTGSLSVGDSVRATLRAQALSRAGRVQAAMLGSDRFFRAALAGEVGGATTPVLLLRGSVGRSDGKARINQAQIVGYTPAFWSLAAHPVEGKKSADDAVLLNRRAAQQLAVHGGEALVIRLEKPSSFSRDAPLSGSEDDTVGFSVQAQAAPLGPEEFGDFSLQASQIPPATIFVPLPLLQEKLGLHQGANLLLSADLTPAALQTAVAAKWQLADAELQLHPLGKSGGSDLRTTRVFLDPAVVQAAPAGTPALTYLVNEIRSGEKSTPYSMATAVEGKGGGLLPAPLGPKEAAISQWLADDLGIGAGAALTLKYYVMGERRQLEERTADFTVKTILPMDAPQLDSSWMPDFPGLTDKKNCRDWDPGFAMDNSRLRDKDEQYWQQYRGTPKVFIGLVEGQQLWSNRWGRLTSIRYPAGAVTEAGLLAALRKQLSPAALGLSFLPLRDSALAAANSPNDFGMLFIYFSFFLVVAAAVLTGLLFVFSLEQRSEEAGLLLAVGWPARRVRRLLLTEGALLAAVGSLAGVLGAVLYTWLVLRGLATVWSSAGGGLTFSVAIQPLTLAIGFTSGLVVALAAMWMASRRQLRRPAGSLLSSAGAVSETTPRRRSWSCWVAGAALAMDGGLLFLPSARSPEGFFGIGSLVLIGGLAWALSRLRRTARQSGDTLSITILGHRNAARRRGRSMATIAVLASGVFMVVAVDAFRLRPDRSPADRQSGTGGFTLLAESSSPIYQDLNSAAGQEALALDAKTLAGVSLVPLRVRDGDDASCLNLNAAPQPRLMAVRPADLAQRHAFRFSQPDESWALLDAPAGDTVPGIVDATTLEWALKGKIGDLLEYRDERGAPLHVRIAGTVEGSILQGSVIIGETAFVRHFPNSGGYRFFLIDAPLDRLSPVSEELARGLTDRGLQVTPTLSRLADFQAVENSYLAIFQALGGLGLLLGSAGLAIVVGRNVLERRGEFGLLQAVGFRSGQLRQLVLAEHRWLIAGGLAIGVASALVGVWPSLHRHSSGFPWREMGSLLGLLILGSLFWTWLATRLALRRHLLTALRNE